jgi:Zn-dependent protease
MVALDTSNPASIFLLVLAFLLIIGLVISVHEASHAYFANRLGDPTARLLGRMTLNPAAHIDPIGTIIVPLVLFIFGGFVFGWAKPTPINPLNFAHPRRDSAIVAFAGPASNFTLAILFSIIFRVFPIDILLILISINLILGIFNLIPIPPLDGYKVLLGIVPKEIALRLAALESYGPIILIVFLLFFIRVFSPIIFAILNFLLQILAGASF